MNEPHAPESRPSALLRALEEFPDEVLRRMIPRERTVLLRTVSKAVRAAVASAKPVAFVKLKRCSPIARLERGLLDMRRWCCVTALDLSEMRVGAEGVAHLAELLRPLCPSLAHLNIQGNGIGAKGTERLTAVLAQCESLAHFDLADNRIGSEGTCKLAGMLSKCPSLVRLEIPRNGVVDEGAGRLAAVLWHCRSLAHLNLCRNGIGPQGAGLLAAVFGKCPSLAHIDLQGNMLGAEGAGRMSAQLGQCTSLTHLDLAGNSMGPEGVRRLAGLVEKCPSLLLLDLSSNGINPGLAGAQLYDLFASSSNMDFSIKYMP